MDKDPIAPEPRDPSSAQEDRTVSPRADDPSADESLGGAETDEHQAGEVIRDRYHLIRVLGKGGFGIVYLAHDRVLDQKVAIKVLKLSLSSNSDRQRFIREARMGAKLRHSAIVNVFDIIQTRGGLQLVMEYYPGGTLAQKVKSEGSLPVKQALDYTRQLAAGLAFAHRKNVIHRDIKPANVFIADDGLVKLGDFGIAAHTEIHDYTSTGDIMGTPFYMAPEQTKDARDVDPRSDIFSLGVTLYNMLTGKPPRIMDLNQFDPEISRLLRKATAFDRQERLVSAKQLIATIDEVTERFKESHATTVALPGVPEFDELTAEELPSDYQPAPLLPPESTPAVSPDEPTLTRGPTTVAIQPRSSMNWSAVALVGVMMIGFLAIVYFMRPPKEPPGSNEAAANRAEVAVAAIEPAVEAPDQADPVAPNGSPDAARNGAQNPPAGLGNIQTAALPTTEPPLTSAGSGEAPADVAPPSFEESPAAQAPPQISDPSPFAQPQADNPPARSVPAARRRTARPPTPLARRAAPEPVDQKTLMEQVSKLVGGADEEREKQRNTLELLIDGLGGNDILLRFAKTNLERYTLATPADPLNWFLLGAIYRTEGNEAEMAKAFEKVHQLDAGFLDDLEMRIPAKFGEIGIEKIPEVVLRKLIPDAGS